MLKDTNLFSVCNQEASTHLALRWKGQTRFTVPREAGAQRACWRAFRPGLLGIPLRSMALLPGPFGAIPCLESPDFKAIRQMAGGNAGLSSCRSGAAGPWHKDTLLFLDGKMRPFCFAKVGAGAAVGALLKNEADWLRKLGQVPGLAQQVPVLIGDHTNEVLSFVLQRPLSGKKSWVLAAPQFEFLRKLHKISSPLTSFENSQLHATVLSRLAHLEGRLPRQWAGRLAKVLQRIRKSFEATPPRTVPAHNDFTPWNIRLHRGIATVFDWEYAAEEQLPLFDPLHFNLLPMALNRCPTPAIVTRLHETVAACRQWFPSEFCLEAESQALAYLINVCTLYLSSTNGNPGTDPVLASYGPVIDRLSVTWDLDSRSFAPTREAEADKRTAALAAELPIQCEVRHG